jgi:phosphate butyryltransferase
MQLKGIHSPIAGDADALVFPNIEAGNVFHKSVTLFSHATLASILLGPSVPVVLPSRADTPETKFLSLALAAALSAARH